MLSHRDPCGTLPPVSDERLQQLAASAAAGWARAQELDLEARRAWEQAQKLDAALQDYKRLLDRATYNADALAVWDKSTAFLDEARFREAYRAGMDSGHHILRAPGSRDDIHVEWRVHVLCWAAAHAARLAGDFVECGVNTGIYSLAVCKYVGFDKLDRDFWLFDTYRGIPESHMAPEERATRIEENASLYSECYELARRNFAPYPRAHLVRGTVPETLASVQIGKVAYLSIDMNIVAPERAAIEHFWPKLVPGGIVVLDDYGWLHFDAQKRSMDEFAARAGVEVLTLPTGQGLLLKP
jgi:O-methyltransferase